MDRQEIERLLDANMHILSTPNVVRIDYGEKVSGGVPTGRPAMVVGVIKKLEPAAIQQPDLLVPPTIRTETASGSIELLETDVVEEGEIVALSGPPVPGSTLILTSGLRAGGSLGVNIQYQGVYRLLSCAHVLTAFDPNFVGKTVNYCEEEWQNPQALTPVTGMVPVTVYTTPNPQNPVRNVQDLAWANITPELGSPEITEIGTPSGIRAPKTEQVQVYGGASNTEVQTTKILSLTARTTVRSLSSDGRNYVYSFWQSVMQLDAGSISLFGGDSGSAVVATADRKVVGLAFSTGSITVYACPIVT